ncbi:hypothetical protein ACHAXR_003914 [Thalassiosira sp. AJA248-18]
MGLFTKRDKEAEPPLVTATPIDYAAASLPTPAQAISTAKFNAAAASSNQQQQPPPLGRHPTNIPICPHCSQPNVLTRTSTFPSFETWICCELLLLVFWPACWVPLVMDNAKKTDHVCTRCNALVGQVKPFSDCCVKNRG